MAQQQIDTTKLYGIIADMMPTEGRDFTIDVKYEDGQKPQLIIKPLTAVGRGFVPALLERLSKPMEEQGVALIGSDEINQELVTINSIKAEIEKNAMARLRSSLEDIQRQHKSAIDAMQNEDKARGDKTLSAEAAKKRKDDADAIKRLDIQRRQIEFMLAHMAEARERVDAASRAAAEADAKEGKDWATDLNAPLTVLFDRQDATLKLKQRESLIQRLSAYMFTVDDITNKAAEVGKQYVLQK